MKTGKKRPVVIDTNVIISGFLGDNHSYPARIVNAWFFNQIVVAVSQELKHELNCVLKKPYIIKVLQNNTLITLILGKLFNKSLMVSPEPVSEVIFPDKTDHFLLELAISSRAEVIVTGDKRLLDVKKANGVFILTPKQFCLQFHIS